MARLYSKNMIGLRLLIAIFIPLCYYACSSTVQYFKTDLQSSFINKNPIRMRKLLQIENETLEGRLNCSAPAVKEFPSDGFTPEQRQSGFIVIHFIIAIYLFLLLAIVCDDFFVPSIKRICEHINVSKDVAGATFMAAATSSPELFINIVGTFVTEGDLGIGTIVGSAVFNILAVPACCGLFAKQVLNLNWWPITRDCLAYGLTVGLLIAVLADGRIEWYEALILVISYILYILAMYFNGRISKFMNLACSKRRRYRKLNEDQPLIRNNIVQSAKLNESLILTGKITDSPLNSKNHTAITVGEYELISSSDDEIEDIVNMIAWPPSILERAWWVFTWPINLALLLTIPDCRRPSLRRYYALTFLMCIVWIATSSYIVAWDITIIGDTLGIPDSVMGLTFLAAGMSVPEAVSSVIVTNQGMGGMGISNSIGSNVFDVLLCLGLPWLIKAVLVPKTPGDYFVQINSHGIVYSSISLFSTLIILYIMLAANKFKLNCRLGVACLFVYSIFLVLASLVELNVFFDVNMPVCVH